MNGHFALMDQQLQKGREFEGNFHWKRKLKGLLNVNCRIVPMNVPGRYDFFIFENREIQYIDDLRLPFIARLRSTCICTIPRVVSNRFHRVRAFNNSNGDRVFDQRTPDARSNCTTQAVKLLNTLSILSNKQTRLNFSDDALLLHRTEAIYCSEIAQLAIGSSDYKNNHAID